MAVVGASDGAGFRRLTLAVEWPDTKVGESVAVNGCCLTVADIFRGELAFDVVPETLHKTNLGLLKGGDEVHVERSLRISDRLDGHFVQGHIDGTARLLHHKSADNEWRLSVEAPAHLAKFLSPKGSVTLDGVSLTIASLEQDRFEVALIPTTLQLTQLGRRPIGWPLNLEADIISKTVVSWLERQRG